MFSPIWIPLLYGPWAVLFVGGRLAMNQALQLVGYSHVKYDQASRFEFAYFRLPYHVEQWVWSRICVPGK